MDTKLKDKPKKSTENTMSFKISVWPYDDLAVGVEEKRKEEKTRKKNERNLQMSTFF